MKTPLGTHHIRSKLYSVPLSILNKLNDNCQSNSFQDTKSPEYRLTSIIMDIAQHRFFKPVKTTTRNSEKISFLKRKFENPGIDAINLGNILHHKNVIDKIPPYFEDTNPPKISYSYTTPIASHIFNYKQTLAVFNINDLHNTPLKCSCVNSPFVHKPIGHIITGDLGFIKNDALKNILSKGPKYRERKSFTRNSNFKIIMDAVQTSARK